MKPVLEIYLDTRGKVTINGTIEDDGLNLQLLLKAAEAVALRFAQKNGRTPGDAHAPLSIVVPGGH